MPVLPLLLSSIHNPALIAAMTLLIALIVTIGGCLTILISFKMIILWKKQKKPIRENHPRRNMLRHTHAEKPRYSEVHIYTLRPI